MQQGQYYPGFEKLKQLPVIRDLWQRQRLNHFLSVNGGGLHYGKFASFDEARAWLPKNPGYDLESLSDEYLEVRTRRIYAFDYPVMFWLRNAFEATPDGGEIAIAIAAEGRTAALAIRDSGPGIPPAVAKQLFTPFFSTKRDGRGLGLTLVREVTLRHGGEVGLHAHPDGGAVAELRLPLD